MKVGDWEIQDTVSYVYFSSLIFMIIWYIVLIVWMTILMHKEIKQPAVDMFKVIQFILIIVWFANCIYTDSWFFWNSYYRTLLARIIYVVLESSLYLYYAVNFLTGYLLIIHIKNLKNLRNGIEYSRWRETIRSIEIKAWIVLIISEFFYILLNTLLVVLSWSFELIKEQINRILSGQFWLISLILIVFQAVLYKRLASAMRSDLNFYFKQKWKGLVFISKVNTFFFFHSNILESCNMHTKSKYWQNDWTLYTLWKRSVKSHFLIFLYSWSYCSIFIYHV